MEQSRAERARANEQNKRKEILQSIPDLPRSSQGFVVFEENCGKNVDISTVVKCEHPLLEAFIRTICTLIEKSEAAVIVATEEHWPALLLYAETAMQKSVHGEYAAIRQMSSFAGFLRKLFDFATETFQLFRNLIQQIRLFYITDPSMLSGMSEVHLRRAWRSLGEILSVFVQLDELILSRPVLRTHFSSYLKTLETALHNPGQFGTNIEQLTVSISALHEIDRFLLSGNSLRYCYEQTLGDLDQCQSFADRMYEAVSEMFARWEKGADEDIPDKRFLLVIVSLSVYYHHHFSNFANKKLVKSVWTSHKKIMSFHLLGDIVFVPCELLMREIGDTTLVDKKVVASIQQSRQSLRTAANIEGMLVEANECRTEVEMWTVEVEADIREREANPAQMAALSLKISQQMLKGVRLADTMTRLLKTALNSFDGELKMTKRLAYNIFDVIEAVKDVSKLFARHWRCFAESVSMASQQWRGHALSLLEQARQTMRNEKSDSREGALLVAINALLYSACRQRVVVCAVTLEMARVDELLKPVDAKQLGGLLTRIETLYAPRRLIRRVTNCSFLLFNKPLIALYWETLLNRKPSLESIQNFCSAISDGGCLCAKAQHDEVTEANVSVVDNFTGEMYEMVKKGLLAPLCGELENDLRVLTHKHLRVENRDRMSAELNGFLKQLLKNPYLRIYDKVINVKEFLSRYLEKTFYNLTVVAPHDALTYVKMADLAAQKYGLEIVDGHLLRGGVDEVLDVLDVTRDLTSFVVEFNYCLNLQLFIEKESPNRSLRVLSIDQMTASLRKHGTGVLATSVNLAYQVLRKKLNVFHHFLSDEHIRAQIQRDVRFFDENQEELNQMYPMKRAEKFSRSIAKLGVAGDEQTYMDKFRILVTQIGNTLGYVRTMTSGAAAVNSELRDYTDNETMAEFVDGVGLVDDVIGFDGLQKGEKAIRDLRDTFNELRTNAEKTRDFTQMLVNVFRSSLATSTEQFAHLAQFYVVVPALTLCHVEHMLTCRERLQRRAASNKEITFSDDGFALGVAYLLSVLNAWPQFTSLNWFRSVLKSLNEEKTEREAIGGSAVRGTHLKLARLQAYEKEFRLLLFTFQSAGVYFSFDVFEE